MKFDRENRSLKNEWMDQCESFISKNLHKLTDAQMGKSLDSIGELYFIIKNKELAVKYSSCGEGLKRLNSLKEKFSTGELREVLKRVPDSLKYDPNYLAVKRYIENDTATIE